MIKRTGRSIAVLLPLALAAVVPAKAQEPVPDLVGVWQATEGGMLLWHGGTVRNGEGSHLTIEIDKQDGPYFSGTMTYTNPTEVGGHDGADLVHTGVEKFIGVIGWDGETITLVDTPDVGYWHTTLVDANTIAVVGVEAGEFAVAGRYMLKRQ